MWPEKKKKKNLSTRHAGQRKLISHRASFSPKTLLLCKYEPCTWFGHLPVPLGCEKQPSWLKSYFSEPQMATAI